ncbi:hypothetical protein GQ44DRAFT_759230 [Phaeosphaeriaceae sp. PMI808]|nr:hypothetical protein GQ44DRAFT_759230 [Phaeosphaeriaceae sp. PMI808]
MKLSLLSLFAIAANAISVPALQVGTFDSTVTIARDVTRREIPYVEFGLRVDQFCESGKVRTTSNFTLGALWHEFTEFDSGAGFSAQIRGKLLNMRYFSSNQSVRYVYGDCKFGPDSASGKMCGWCNDITNGWTGEPIKCETGIPYLWRACTRLSNVIWILVVCSTRQTNANLESCMKKRQSLH